MPNSKRRDDSKETTPHSLSPPSSGLFILSTSQASIKPDDESRRLIRCHVMKGKNRKHVASQQRAVGSWINGSVSNQLLPQGPWTTLLGPQVNGSALCVMKFAVEMEPYMLQLIYDFITVMKKASFPIERCVDMGREEQHWLQDLSHDPAYVHTVLYVAQAYFGFVKSNTSLGPTALMHMNKTILLLRRRLEETSPNITDSTIYVVLALATVSEAMNDLDATKAHLCGLHEIIKFRGGMPELAQKHSLQIKCCRLDLRFALKTGSKPLFFADDNLSWEKYLVDPIKVSTPTPVEILCETPDTRLVDVWLDLLEFATTLNLASQTQRTLSPALFQEALISVQYRLQHLKYESHDQHEILRVAMLGFSATIFLELHAAPSQYRLLKKSLRSALQSLRQYTHVEWLKLTLWLIFVSGTSVLDAPEDFPWLKDVLLDTSRALGLTSWEETRRLLKSIVWVDVVHDEPSRRLFDDVMSA